jgi:hypothetical protein
LRFFFFSFCNPPSFGLQYSDPFFFISFPIL